MMSQKSLFKKIGFYQALELLNETPITLNQFHTDLHKIKSYYNAFRRVKEEMIKKGLIKIYKENKHQLIKLTQKGFNCKHLLNAVSEMV